MTESKKIKYVTDENKDTYVDMIISRLGFLSHMPRKHVLNCLNDPTSNLLPFLKPQLFNSENNSYISLSDSIYAKGRNHEKTEQIIRASIDVENLPRQDVSFFTNTMSVPELVDQGNGRGPGYYPRPKDRTVNSGVYVHTIEYDITTGSPEEIKDFLAKQIGWSRGGEYYTSCLIGQVYKEMTRFIEFRGLEMVWSGNKSCHIHIAFDTKHLAATRYKVRKMDEPWGDIQDLPDGVLRKGFEDAWWRVADIVSGHTQVSFAPDKTLRFPDSYRRLPWGMRSVKSGNAFGFSQEYSVPQIVLWTKFRKTRSGSTEWFHDPARFLELDRAASARSPRATPRATESLSEDAHDAFILELADLCRSTFHSEYPEPVRLSNVADGYAIHFKNHATDQRASSVAVGGFAQILIQGSREELQAGDYFLPLSANKLVEQFLDQGHLDSEDEPSHPQGFIEKKFRRKLVGLSTREGIRSLLSKCILPAAHLNKRSCILTQEGPGKTTTFLNDLPNQDPWIDGILMVACRSYEQAEEKCEQFNSMNENKGENFYEGVVVQSFSILYKGLAREDRITVENAAASGCSSVMEAAYKKGGEIVEQLEKYKSELWGSLRKSVVCRGKNHPTQKRLVMFVAQATAQLWHIKGGTRMWLHPRYREYIEAKFDGHDNQLLADEIYNSHALQWLIYDEVTMADLIGQYPAKEVDWCLRFQAVNQNWRNRSLADQMEAFSRHLSQNPINDMKFDDCQKILRYKFGPNDAYTADTKSEKFGIQNSSTSYYAAVNGKRRYVKPRDWWRNKPHKITFLTTERRMFSALQSLNEKVGADFTLYDFDTKGVLPNEHSTVNLYFDNRARSVKTDGVKDINILIEKLKQVWPDSNIISNVAEAPKVITHDSARGSNDFAGSDVTTGVYLMIDANQYEQLLIENAYFGRNDMVKKMFLDQFNQTCGRTLGFRYHEGSENNAVMSKRLWDQISTILLRQSRYLINRCGKLPTTDIVPDR